MMEDKYSEAWQQRYREDVAAGESYWRNHPYEWKHAVERADINGWGQGRDLGTMRDRWNQALANQEEKNERNPKSWHSKRMTEKRFSDLPPTHIDKNHTQGKDLFSDI